MKHFDSFTSIKKNVSLYFDNALSQEDEQKLLKQIDDDPQCSQIFKKEKTAREFLKNNLQRSTCTSTLIDDIRNRLGQL